MDIRHAGGDAAFGAAFVWFEGRLGKGGGSPLVDLKLLTIPSFRRGVLVGTLFFFTTAFYVLFAIYEQEGYGTDPLYTGIAILPYGIGLFIGPLITASLVRLRPWLLTIGMAIQVFGYAAVAAVIVLGFDGWPVMLTVLLAGFGQGIAYPRLFNTALGDVPPHQAGVAAGVLTSALQIGAAISVAGIGSLFFAVLGHGGGRECLCPRLRMCARRRPAPRWRSAMLLSAPRACAHILHSCAFRVCTLGASGVDPSFPAPRTLSPRPWTARQA